MGIGIHNLTILQLLQGRNNLTQRAIGAVTISTVPQEQGYTFFSIITVATAETRKSPTRGNLCITYSLGGWRHRDL